jgi:hypothetical protein
MRSRAVSVHCRIRAAESPPVTQPFDNWSHDRILLAAAARSRRLVGDRQRLPFELNDLRRSVVKATGTMDRISILQRASSGHVFFAARAEEIVEQKEMATIVASTGGDRWDLAHFVRSTEVRSERLAHALPKMPVVGVRSMAFVMPAPIMVKPTRKSINARDSSSGMVKSRVAQCVSAK